MTQTIPDPTSLGALQYGTVNPTSDFTNVRPSPDTNGTPLRQLHSGDSILYRPKTFTGGTYSVGGRQLNQWYMLDKGYLAAGVVTITPGAPDVPKVTLDVPFVSQTGPTANRRGNDCGAAAALSVIRWKYQKLGLLDPSLITVDDMALHTSLATVDDGLTLAEISALLKGYGVQNVISRPLTTDVIAQEIRAGIPPLALVNDKYLGGTGVGHYVVGVAVGERGFWVHDPDHKGASHYMTTAELDTALKDVLQFNSYTYQGIIPT
jgi:hypothetical protein